MRLSTQLGIGYAVALIASGAVACLALGYSNALQDDITEVAAEWGELDAVTGAVAAVRSPTQGRVEALRTQAERLDALATKERGDGTSDGAHESAEAALFHQLADTLRQAARAPESDIPAYAARLDDLALAHWKEDFGRVPLRMSYSEERRRRLWATTVVSGALLLLAPVLVLGLVHLRIGRPLARIQQRVEALAQAPDGKAAGRSSMALLERTIDDMASAVESQRAHLEHQVAERTEQLRHANRLGGLGRIAAAVAHELNTPLASIGLCLDGLREAVNVDDADGQRYLRTIADQVQACTATSRKLLSYARYKATAPEDGDIRSLLAESLDLVRAHLRTRRVEVDVACAENLTVHGDLAQIRQVFVNLILNAADASPEGTRIRVACERETDQVVVSVADEGPGIPADLGEEVFNPFFTTKRPGEGTGLGLSIAREIAEVHGGSLALEPHEPGAGAVFRVRLPGRAA